MVKRTFNRAERVGGQVQRVLANLIQKGVNDPRLAQATITGVVLSRDLRIAKIYFATPGGEVEKETILSGFESARGFIKRELARELGLRYMPDLKFFYDGSFDYGAQINRVLKSLQTDDETNNPTTDEQ
ncbi:Ribosome-binding factor A [Desulfosarcina cetonica]|uniref:30S ribosome-binding factor RbfA n=1 Tax=Desulfosarcina cetonica TaxID=90730 RepID=UPI0006D275E5|nr:30S ribosome-binding factor RbfA [Desulfosarcina cetonica]VTR69743.1 Ribosome-binding factor A [Desulfosarcina cetonica]